MSLKLMYITNRVEVAKIAQAAGVDRIFVDMEHIGKADRQGGMDTVQSRHTLEDIERIRAVTDSAQLLVRCNPIHDGSESEIDGIVARGADMIMLPYFKSRREAETFIKYVRGRAKTMLLVETPEAAESLDDILSADGIDEVYVGLNDLSLGYGRKFMFELLADGTVERLCAKFAERGLPYGFGGIAAPGSGTLPAEKIIMEHYRLGSTSVILSRSFCNTNLIGDLEEIRAAFENGVKAIRQVEQECVTRSEKYEENRRAVCTAVKHIMG